MKKINVSVLISTYKEPWETLHRSLNSLLKQTLPTIEIILVFDGNHHLVNAVEELRDERLKIIVNEKNLGLTKSLNIAAKVSTGKYMARLDADDEATPDRLEKQFLLLESLPNHVLLGASESAHGKELSDADLRAILPWRNPFTHSTLFFRRDAFFLVGGYNEEFRYSQDYDLVAKLLGVGRGHIVAEQMTIRSIGTHQISVSRQNDQRFCALMIKLSLLKQSSFNLSLWLSIAKTTLGFLYYKAKGTFLR